MSWNPPGGGGNKGWGPCSTHLGQDLTWVPWWRRGDRTQGIWLDFWAIFT